MFDHTDEVIGILRNSATSDENDIGAEYDDGFTWIN
jgi:hypothetical protein